MPPRRTRVTNVLERCVGELCDLSQDLVDEVCDDPEKQFALREAIPCLSGLLCARSKIAAQAAKALTNISRSATHGNDGRSQMAEHGTIQNLVALLLPEAPEAAIESLRCLRSMAIYSVYKRMVVESGALSQLVRLLRLPHGPIVSATVDLLDVVCNFTNANKDSLQNAGGVQALVELLDGTTAVELELKVEDVLRLLSKLTVRDGCRDALHRANAIPVLLRLLEADDKAHTPNSVGNYAIAILASLPKHSSARSHALCATERALEILFAQLTATQPPQPKSAAQTAADRLLAAVNSSRGHMGVVPYGAPSGSSLVGSQMMSEVARHAEACLKAVMEMHPAPVLAAYLEASARAAKQRRRDDPDPIASFTELKTKLTQEASRALRAAESGEGEAALVTALHVAEQLNAPENVLNSARRRLRELRDEGLRASRRASLGVDTDVIPFPREFVCPITLSRMIDPVVASDGHSYERAAIQTVLDSPDGRSPLTREDLRPTVIIPNHALRRRIREYDDELLRVAEAARRHQQSGGPSAEGSAARSEDVAAGGGASKGAGGLATTRARKRARADSPASRTIALTLRGGLRVVKSNER